MLRLQRYCGIGIVALAAMLAASCGHGSAPEAGASGASGGTGTASAAAAPQPGEVPAPSLATAAQGTADAAPPASETGGFDGAAAYDYAAKMVAFGPRPPASDAIHRTQSYIISQLQGFGCEVDQDDFHSQTPIGDLLMKNIVAKVPGEGQGIILLLTHYDTLRLDNFVGAEDGASSSSLLIEMAKLLCGKKQANAVWIAFLDGEEAQVVKDGAAQWTAADSVYGSRELAARMAVSGELKRVRAIILADMIGQKGLKLSRDSNSTKWLTDIVWSTAARLGYTNIFVSQESAVDDDHMPFIHRGVPATDVIDLDDYANSGYWHTPQDTLDKLSPRNMAIVGQVILESVAELQKKFH